MALTDNLKAYWKLDETSGTRYDSTANDYDLTDNNTVTYEVGLISNAAKMTAANSEYLSINNNFGIAGSGNKTLSFWIKQPSELNSGTWFFFSLRSSIASASLLQIQYDYNSGTRRVTVNDGGTVTHYNVTLGTNWRHFVYVRNGTSGKLYIDNSEVISATVGNSGGTDNYFQLGAAGASYYANASFDETGLWSRALTTDEIAELYNSGSGLTYPFSSEPSGPTRAETLRRFRRHR